MNHTQSLTKKSMSNNEQAYYESDISISDLIKQVDESEMDDTNVDQDE